MLCQGGQGSGTYLVCLPSKPFVRPGPEARGRCGGTPFVPTPSGDCGAQRRARAAPLGAGTGATRSHAQRPLGREHGEDGEDPPLARSEHRGTHHNRSLSRLSTHRRNQLSEKLTD